MNKTYRCPKCGDSKAKYDYALRKFACPIDYTPFSEYQQRDDCLKSNETIQGVPVGSGILLGPNDVKSEER